MHDSSDSAIDPRYTSDCRTKSTISGESHALTPVRVSRRSGTFFPTGPFPPAWLTGLSMLYLGGILEKPAFLKGTRVPPLGVDYDRLP
jgi:hypothetical protein